MTVTGAVARRRSRVGHVEDHRALDRAGLGHRSVARQEDVDRRRDVVAVEAAERPGERVDDVGQAAGLGPRLAFRGEKGHAHRHGAPSYPPGCGLGGTLAQRVTKPVHMPGSDPV